MKKIFFAVLVAAAAAACTPKTSLSGIVPEGNDADVMVQIRDLGIDTAITPEGGKFAIDLPVDKTVFAVVMFGEKHVSFIPDGSAIKVDFTAEEPALDASKVKGANLALVQYQEWNDEFMNRYREAASKNVDSLLLGFEEEYQNKMKDLAKQDNVLGLIGIQNIQSYLQPAQMRELLAGVAPSLKDNKMIKTILNGLDAKEATAVGKMFTDFEVEQPDGSVKKLSNYVGKGKYILADFWASWCGPCRREIPNIKNVYDKFAGEKFDVVSIAVWDKVEDTMKAIEEEGLKWNQIINGQQIPTDAYGIEGIPELVLFGPDGTILMRGDDLRGENMEPAIANYVK